MDRNDCLDAAIATVADRGDKYGKPQDVLTQIAGYWTIKLAGKLADDAVLTAADVAGMMILMKQARADFNAAHADNWVDMAGYASLGAEVARAS